jgi:16S rRNA (guanine(1405)-N(7))-methyltransferase
MVDALQRIIEQLRDAPKYRNLCEETLARTAAYALARHKNAKDALKAAKRKLHQVYGAYFDQVDLPRIERLVNALPASPPEADLRATCRQILQCHASTRERLAILDAAFSALFAETGPPKTIADLACGLQPFAVPWMNLAPDTRYCAFDIDRRLTAAINTFFARAGRPGTAECRDVLVTAPEIPVDVAFLLKTLPGLERQKKGSAAELLERLRARHVVVSFPAKSLGGREKGMGEHYGAFMDALASRWRIPVRRIAFPGEVFYLLRFQSGPR